MLMKARTRFYGAAIASVSLTGTAAHAYKIYPVEGVHEAITLAAQVCASESGAVTPQGCFRYLSDVQRLVTQKPGGKVHAREFGDLEIAVRWPDDPTREIAISSLAKFGVTAGWRCKHIVKKQLRIDSAGLRCSSHYGALQFLHAMRSSTAEDDESTRRKVLAWTDFTYRFASGRIDPTTSYCGYFSEHPSAISAVLYPPGFQFCDRWLVKSLFTWSCKKPLSSGRCGVIDGLGSDLVARRAATGALLHAIQDSYSESHTSRHGNGGSEKGPFGRVMRCGTPSRFYFYNQQSTKVHGRADYAPQEVESSCASNIAGDDAITATATAIWLLQRNAGPELLSRYLMCRVLGEPPNDTGSPLAKESCNNLRSDLARLGDGAVGENIAITGAWFGTSNAAVHNGNVPLVESAEAAQTQFSRGAAATSWKSRQRDERW